MRNVLIILILVAAAAGTVTWLVQSDSAADPDNVQPAPEEIVAGPPPTISPLKGAGAPSNIKTDERVLFFDTAAHLSADGTAWILPIHAWIFEPADSRVRKSVVARTLKQKYNLTPTEQTQPNFERRVDLFLADNERDKRLLLEVGDNQYALPASSANGHVHVEVHLSIEQAEAIAVEGAVPIRAVPGPDDDRTFPGRVWLVGPEGISVISDIDDTVKVTHVTDRARLLDQTFFQDFTPAPGMAELYSRWAERGVQFHYVSSSPWHLYEPLAEFLQHSGFPPATLNLKSFRFRDTTLLNLFKKGTETKPLQISPLLSAWPQRRFVLVGDSGEQDPEVYAELMRKHPKQILACFIRNVDGSAPSDPRFREVFDGIDPDTWTLFDDPGELELPR